jgi:hypothetical protein
VCFEVWSRQGAGTEIEWRVAARLSYLTEKRLALELVATRRCAQSTSDVRRGGCWQAYSHPRSG